eukprot:1462493-Pyramimonas_sp.AAC.1
MAVAMGEDGAGLSGDCSRYKRRACAGPEEQGEVILQLKARASPQEIATAHKQTGVKDDEVQKHGPMVHAILADLADGHHFEMRKSSLSRP